MEMISEGVKLYPAGTAGAPVIYAHLEASEAERVLPALEGRASLVLLSCDWNRDLSPWPAPKAFKGGQDFAEMGSERKSAWCRKRLIPCQQDIREDMLC